MIDEKIEKYLKKNKIEFTTDHPGKDIEFADNLIGENIQPIFWIKDKKTVILQFSFINSFTRELMKLEGWTFIGIISEEEIEDKLKELKK